MLFQTKPRLWHFRRLNFDQVLKLSNTAVQRDNLNTEKKQTMEVGQLAECKVHRQRSVY